MNFKSRIRNIERKLYLDNEGIDENELLNPNYKFKGIPFNSISDMIEALNVVELSPYYLDDQIIQFYLNGLLSYESIEMEEIRHKTLEEMKKMM